MDAAVTSPADMAAFGYQYTGGAIAQLPAQRAMSQPPDKNIRRCRRSLSNPLNPGVRDNQIHTDATGLIADTDAIGKITLG